jgi:FG-GAP-like repeat/ASPIC and UnbV
MSRVEKRGKIERVAPQMSTPPSAKKLIRLGLVFCSAGIVAAGVTIALWAMPKRPTPPAINYLPRRSFDTSGMLQVSANLHWNPAGSLQEIASAWNKPGYRGMQALEKCVSAPPSAQKVQCLLEWATLANFEGEPRKAYDMLAKLRSEVEEHNALARDFLFTIIFYQGLTALRCGETENCILCRGESSCILPISRAAIHTNPLGSRQAIEHFTEYLRHFDDDYEVRWLLNVAHMTLGEHPNEVDPKFVIRLDHYLHNEFDIGKFHDIGNRVGIDRFNQAGGAILDDFDKDGLLDFVVTSWDPGQPMAFFRNKGDGTFEDRTEAAGLLSQLGGLYCVQTDYNNDGHLDIFIPRGAWHPLAMPPSLLRNNGNGTFTDVTREAGLLYPANSNSATWADFDNDGFLDLFVCCERQPNRLFHNKGDGTFEEVAAKAGVQGRGQFTKGAAWIDYDNDGYPDLFINNLNGPSQLFHNNRNGTFTDVTSSMGINGPFQGFSCWAFDYDNDGWLDIFATSYDRTLPDVIHGLTGEPHDRDSNKLYRNLQGKGFQDVTKEAGLDMVFSTMGSNFGDFDNDGYLDFYLGTGDPSLSLLIPNRMFKNVAGKRFSEVTSSSGTGHLQKGHGVACGDWKRDGNIDIFIEMGGATPGDRYHNILFQNPGHDNQWLTVKLVGKKTNRAAIGARIKVVTAGDKPLTIHRHISSGSSFGANPLQQTIGLGKTEKVALLEIYWPTSGTTQVFRDVAVNQALEVTEFATDYRKLDWQPIKLPQPK